MLVKTNKHFAEKHFFSILEKLFTLYTKPKLAQIRPKMGFSQAKRLYHSALGEILEIIFFGNLGIFFSSGEKFSNTR